MWHAVGEVGSETTARANATQSTAMSLTSSQQHPQHAAVKSLDGLQRDMLGALDEDQRKEQVNDAKLRAVAQHVEYDEFANLVAGAHLKPVQPRTPASSDVSKGFDGFVMPKYDGRAAIGPAAPPPRAASVGPALSEPQSSNEFLRVWRRQCKTPADRYAYLRLLQPDTLPPLFRTEIDATVFDGLVEAVRARVAPLAADGEEAAEAPGPDECAWVERLLQQVARLPRFDLTLEFAATATPAALSAIFDALQSAELPAGGEGRLDEEALAGLLQVGELEVVCESEQLEHVRHALGCRA